LAGSGARPGQGGAPDKAGKDNNYRGVTEFGGALTQHAGLEKWSLVNGVWQLDYVLTNGGVAYVGN
jgi:hypothetical protein